MLGDAITRPHTASSIPVESQTLPLAFHPVTQSSETHAHRDTIIVEHRLQDGLRPESWCARR